MPETGTGMVFRAEAIAKADMLNTQRMRRIKNPIALRFLWGVYYRIGMCNIDNTTALHI